MKFQTTKKFFALTITVMMFSVLPEFTNAQRKCPIGQFLICDQNGKHCKCETWPRPCRSCGGFFSDSKSAGISFSLAKPEKISAKIFEMTGRLVKTLADKTFEPGDHELKWDAAGANAGIYMVQFNADSYNEMKKICVLK